MARGTAIGPASAGAPRRGRGWSSRSRVGRRLLRRPVVELFEQRAERLHPALGRLGPDLLKDPFDTGEILRRLRDPARADRSVAGRSWTSVRSPASATR